MKSKKILLIEDQEEQRVALAEIFRMLGFEVISPNSLSEARHLTTQNWEEINVGVIDMDLKEWDESKITGAELIIEIRKTKQTEKNTASPEFIVLTAHSNVPYYRFALELGVAAYLPKNESGNRDYQLTNEPSYANILRYIRVLALRHALRPEHPDIEMAISRIAAISPNQTEAVIKFCEEVLAPELKSCLGTPFLILFSDEEKTQVCCHLDGLPVDNHDFFHTLQALSHNEGNVVNPFVLNSELLKHTLQSTDIPEVLFEKLNGAAFLPLTLKQNLRLSLVILQQDESETVPIVEDAVTLCRLLGQHLKPTLIEHIITILSQWNKLRTMMHNTSQLCLLFGQEQKNILRRINFAEELPSILPQLQVLARDLYSTGETLTYIMESSNDSPSLNEESVAEFVKERWNEIADVEFFDIFQIQDSEYKVQVESDDFYIIISRLLQWLAKRRKETPSDIKPVIKVSCSETEDWNEIIFEDRSFRLSRRLRDELFLPFSQSIPLPFERISKSNDVKDSGLYLPLYLVKMLVEGKYGGWVEDRSDEIESEYGNKILVRFPKVVQISAKPGFDISESEAKHQRTLSSAGSI